MNALLLTTLLLSQNPIATFQVESDDQFEVSVVQAGKTLRCAQPVTRDLPCALEVSTGPARVLVSGSASFEFDFEYSGSFTHVLAFRDNTMLVWGVVTMSAGFVATVVGIALPTSAVDTSFEGITSGRAVSSIDSNSYKAGATFLGVVGLATGVTLTVIGVLIRGDRTEHQPSEAGFALTGLSITPQKGGATAELGFRF